MAFLWLQAIHTVKKPWFGYVFYTPTPFFNDMADVYYSFAHSGLRPDARAQNPAGSYWR
ncbi:MAG: hypothetical protein KF690_03700 [Bacteroidetes bacterium]|nr:hypothetical protein [Bacteroidota bacterium]